MGVKQFTIDRKTWNCAELCNRYEKAKKEPLETALLEPESGTMCCLGFYATACGVPKNILENRAYPSGLPRGRSKLSKALFEPLPSYDAHSDDAERILANINDNANISAATRERRVAKAFAEIGVKVKFKGKYPTVREIKKSK
jgi:hypothetical protein